MLIPKRLNPRSLNPKVRRSLRFWSCRALFSHLLCFAISVTLDSKYNPNILPGHDDPQIRHTGTVQVNQFDWRREDGSLITPGDYYRVLLPGTKVLIGASFRLWDVNIKGEGRSLVRLICNFLLNLR